MAGTTTDRRQGITSSVAIKVPCKAATTTNITLSGEQTIDSIACVTDDRVLVKNQTDASENGIYYVNTSSWSRAPDWDGSLDVKQGTKVRVNSGTQKNFYVVSTADPITIGTTEVELEATDSDSVLREDLASTASGKGAALVGYIHGGTGATARTVLAKLREFVTPQDFGATADGVADDTAEIQAAITASRTVYFPPGTYKITDRLLVTTANTTLWLGPNCTLNVSGWTYPGSQSPFGNQIHITAKDCAVIGSGPSSLIQITNASDANGIGFLHVSGGYVGNLTLDGAKSGVTAVVDDTFQSGISLINDSGTNTSGESGQFIIENCIIRNWTQYGVNLYGDMVTNTKIRGCAIHDNGKSAEALSVGAGVVITKGCYGIEVSGCDIYSNKNKGIFQSSAGDNSGRFRFVNNNIYSNGSHGISCTEESQFSSISGQGTDGVVIAENAIYSNTGSGVVLGTYNSVGFLKNSAVSGNVISANGAYGVLVQTNNHATDRTSNVNISGNTITVNTQYGIGIGANNTTVLYPGNIILGNTAGEVEDSGSGGTAGLGNLSSATIPVAEAGTFTPGIEGTSTAGTTTYTTQLGRYTKSEGRVFFDIVLVWTGQTGTGNLKITGLPFTAGSGAQLSVAWALVDGLTITGQCAVIVQADDTTALVYAVENGSLAALAVDTAATLRVSGSYPV